MLDRLVNELGGRGFGVVFGLFVGGLLSGLVGWWRRRRLRHDILRGNARDTVVIHHHIVERRDDGFALRIRSLGHDVLERVVPNGHLAGILARRANAATPHNTLISMAGAEGSYLLETLTDFVCGRVANRPFEHALYVMAPCCEPAELAEHQPITVLLVAVADLALFRTLNDCRCAFVEHGSDGSRLLTLMELASRYEAEQAEIVRRRAAGVPTKWAETMYVLDLALDRRAAGVPVRPVPWGRFEAVLKGWGPKEPGS